MIKQNERGSIWRKWDLHIHAPTSALNNQFKGVSEEEKWEKYIDALENITDIDVLGITDYFSIDGYKKVMEYKKQGRLKNITLFIPNIELRITPVTSRNKPIDMHLIINPVIVEKVESLIFQSLVFKIGNRTYRCTREDLIALGRDFNNNQNMAEIKAYRKGVNQFKVNYTDIDEIIKDNEILHNNVLIAVPNSSKDGVSGIQDDNLKGVRKQIYRMSDIILSGNESTIAHFLGNGIDKVEIIKNYGSLKPCITASDAHSLETIGVFPKNRFTWIKADPTFEGLRQILFEPEERVHIGEQSPDHKPDYQVIESVVINHSDFYSEKIPLNPNLNTIIGGRASGKSMLLGCIAKKTGSKKEVKKDNDKYNEFIEKVVQEVTLTWRDSESTEKRKVEYYPQNHINGLAADSYELRKILQTIISSDKKRANILQQYDRFCTENKRVLNREITRHMELYSKLSIKKKELESKGSKDGITKEIEKIQSELSQIQKALKSPLTKDDDEDYKTKLLELDKQGKLIEALTKDMKALKKVSEVNLFIDINDDIDMMSIELRPRVKLIYNGVVKEAHEQWSDEIQTLIKRIEKQVEEKKKKIDEIENDQLFKKCRDFYNSNTLFKSKNDALKAQQSILDDVNDVEKEIERIQDDIIKSKAKIFKLFTSYYSEAKEYEDLLTFNMSEIQVITKVQFDENEYNSVVAERIDKRRIQSREYVEYQHTSPENFHSIIESYFDSLIQDEINLQSNYNKEQVMLDVFSTNFFNLMFDVNYQGDVLSEMSEGKKAFIILKLLLEYSDNQCPILIDQPEDDLDNRSIYKELAQYLREIKKKRQVIVVTHNPNVVVGADAEGIIVANQGGAGTENLEGKKFQYFTGSIERTFRNEDANNFLHKVGIREHVCEILEGGEEALKQRERKLGCPN